MKLTNLIWVLALAGSVAACNSGSPLTNVRPPTGGGGSSGECDLMVGSGACMTEENIAVYKELEYTDEAGVTYSCNQATTAIGGDCVFGAADSVPPLEGCAAEAANVIFCFPNCPDETIQAAADCVADCVQTATEEIAPPGLSDDCVACTGATVACGAALCTNVCAADPGASECIECRCVSNCTPVFDTCSGLPSSGDCG